MAVPYVILTVNYLFIIITGFTEVAAAGGRPPSPGFYPNSRVKSISFNQGYRTLWGGQHQRLQQGILSLWLDRSSGSGFKSLTRYKSGLFGVSMKLHPGYTAGVISSFYLSNSEDFPGHHDEVDIEFLGTTPGKPYTLQTNVYIRGSGDGTIIGREKKYHLWFDPTKGFHHYSILWTPIEIIFFVDDVPIRRYPRKSDATFPIRPMWVYGSIWDASSWATENGKYKADYNYQPFVAKYTNFKVKGCPAVLQNCRSTSVSPAGGSGLSRQQLSSMQWVHRNYLVYDYCRDSKRDRTQIPECTL